MRYALLGDIHANLPALEAVLRDVSQQDAMAVHLGDLVGYAPWPNEVVQRIATSGIAGVSGNYDSTVATGYKHCGCKYEDPRQEELSHLSYGWTLQHTSVDSKRFLAGLPFRLDLRPLGGHVSGPRLVLFHGTPLNNLTYWTADRSDDFCRKMAGEVAAAPGDVLAFGHTHIPWHRAIDGVHFVNAGSVGRPKDGDWRACYALVDMSASAVHVHFRRVEYDVNAAAKGIRASALPDEFAFYLLSGGRSIVAV
ncbi:MAG: metallophosphoesterase family protein [Gemmatimonadota bacterium]